MSVASPVTTRAACRHLWRTTLAVSIATASLPALAQPVGTKPVSQDLTGFLDELGTATIKVPKGYVPSEAQFLLDQGDAIAGHRWLSDKRPKDAMATARRARALFGDECRANGGALDDEASPSTRDLEQRVVKPYIGRRIGVDYWRSLVGVCAAPSGRVLGGFVAIVHDNSEMTMRGDAGSALLTAIFGLPSTTAVYVLRPTGIATNAAVLAEERRQAALLRAEREAREAALRRFHAGLKIGSETNCGTVIQVRDPMMEIAVRASLASPRGQSTFWSRRELLQPYGSAPCTFGL